ncbi:MAG TPA: carbon storage regulator [Gammaproteobacteria bacterium]|nr:carbon storage regulator [Gammaproteobacteria bacterium]
MLVLTRRIGESLIINGHIKLTVLGVNGNQVRIGTDAPTGMPVHREEIHLKILEERAAKRAAARPRPKRKTISIR